MEAEKRKEEKVGRNVKEKEGMTFKGEQWKEEAKCRGGSRLRIYSYITRNMKYTQK